MERNSALKIGTSRKSRGSDEKSASSLSSALADAKSTEERREIFAADLKAREDEFDADGAKVAKLLQNNDVDGLIEHGSRHIPEQAAARVAAIRAGK